jgi:DNA-binding MarR family transcriptional regulator
MQLICRGQYPLAVMSAASGAPEEPDATVSAIEQALTQLVRHANLPRVHARLAAMIGVAIDRAAYAALSRLGECGPLRLSDLACVMGVDASTASRQVQALEREGLVRRRSDPGDQRVARLELTEAGSTALLEAQRARRQAVQELLADWSQADREALARLLGRLSHEIARLLEAPEHAGREGQGEAVVGR